MNADGRSLFVFSVHAPTSHATRPRQPYVEEVMNILDLLGRQIPAEADLILGGDFNLRSLGERNDKETFKTSTAERKCLARFADLGLVSCWATAHPGYPLPQTLRWNGDKTPDKSTPYHCDGIFVPAAWKQGIICEVLTSAYFEVSDHNPVVAWISR
jgi:exonuclease III